MNNQAKAVMRHLLRHMAQPKRPSTLSIMTYNEIRLSYVAATGSRTSFSWSGIVYQANAGADYSNLVGRCDRLKPNIQTKSSFSRCLYLQQLYVDARSCLDLTNVPSLNQQYSGATGAVLNVQNSGSGSAINVTANDVSPVPAIVKPITDLPAVTGLM